MSAQEWPWAFIRKNRWKTQKCNTKDTKRYNIRETQIYKSREIQGYNNMETQNRQNKIDIFRIYSEWAVEKCLGSLEAKKFKEQKSI